MNWTILEKYPDSRTESLWQEFLADAVMPTHYVTPDFFADPFVHGKRFAVLVTDEQDQIAAILTGTDSGKVIDSGLAVRPQTAFRKGTNYEQAAAALIQALKEKGGRECELITFYSWEHIPEFEAVGFTRRSSADSDLIIMLDLAAGAEAIFKDFSQTRRNEIRKALKQDLLQIKDIETDAEIRELYEIHKIWNASKGNQPNSWEDFERAVLQQDHRKVIIAKHEGKVIAGSYYRYCKGGVVEYAANNSLTEFQKLRPNDLIGWHSIQWACDSGFSHYSMGGSHLFLRRFGGYEMATHRYRLDLTFMHTHQKKEAFKDFLVKTYRSIPAETRQKMKQMVGKK